MTTPLDVVYLGRLARRSSTYHTGPRFDPLTWASLTHCRRHRIADCDTLSETEAVLNHEPCARCFPVRGRRQRILAQIGAGR